MIYSRRKHMRAGLILSIVMGIKIAGACEPGKTCPKAGATKEEKAAFDKKYHGDHKDKDKKKTKKGQ
jgi:hypothetical protein